MDNERRGRRRERREAESENSGGCWTERMRTSELGTGSRKKSNSNGVSEENVMKPFPDGCPRPPPLSIKTLTTAM